VPDPFESLASRAVPRSLGGGEVLWFAGDAATHVVLVQDGVLEVVQHSLQGEDAVLNRLHGGELAGEMSCLDGLPHSATLRAGSAALVYCLDREAFLQWLSEDPTRLPELLRRVSARLRALSSRLAEVSFDPVLIRVARFLVTSEDQVRVTQQQIAQHLAATRESVSKALNHFARRGWLKLGRGHLQVLNRAALGEVAREGN
jgi:CRP/FNR family transcriptional regulator, cyclic AMP receptor protein